MARRKRGGARGAAHAPEHAGTGRRTRRARTALTEPVGGGPARLEPDPDRARGWTLVLDGAPQSHVDLDDPAYLDFAYQRRFGHVADLVAPPGRPVRAVHLGGGALTLARYVAATRPRSTQQVAEVDGALVRFVRHELPLENGWRVKVRTADAREALGRIPDDWADLVFSDVFEGARTPAHLNSAEFLAEARRVLCPGGLYAANLADGAGPGRPGDGGTLPHLRAQIATAHSVFGEVCVVADPAVLRGRRFGNTVLVAGDAGLPLAELTRRTAGDPHPGRVEHGRALVEFTGGAAAVTDRTAVPSPRPPEGALS